jgi:hypothetical protein
VEEDEGPMSSEEVESGFNDFVQKVKTGKLFWGVYVWWEQKHRKFFQGMNGKILDDDDLIGVLFELSISRKITEISSNRYGQEIGFPAIALHITFGESGSVETNVSEKALSTLSELPK